MTSFHSQHKGLEIRKSVQDFVFGYNSTSPTFFPDHLKISEGLSGPFNDFSDCFLRTVIQCTTNAEDVNR
jgi:hypothetical protein